ncbi:hypothetical protein GCM10027174_12550 [Salinifilum aidingensis]
MSPVSPRRSAEGPPEQRFHRRVLLRGSREDGETVRSDCSMSAVRGSWDVQEVPLQGSWATRAWNVPQNPVVPLGAP